MAGHRLIEVPADQEWTLATERLVLAPMLVRDAAELYELLRPLDSDAPVEDMHPASLEDLRTRIRRWESRRSPDGAEVWLNWTLRLKKEGSVVGRAQATVTDAWAEMAWVIGRRYRNQGYATEAGRCIADWLLDLMSVGEVRATIHPGNTASQRVAAKVGMRRKREWTNEGDEVWTYPP